MLMQSLKKLMLNILKEAASNGARSIAFATFGTGNLNYPPDQVATTMYTAISEFDASASSPTLKDVRFVVFTQNMQVYQVCPLYSYLLFVNRIYLSMLLRRTIRYYSYLLILILELILVYIRFNRRVHC